MADSSNLRSGNRNDSHGWLCTETLRTPFGEFEFKNGYPTPASAQALLDQLKFNRAIEVYFTQLPALGVFESRRGVREFGAKRPNQVIIWETLMDAQTLVLTANTETVYGMGFLDQNDVAVCCIVAAGLACYRLAKFNHIYSRELVQQFLLLK